MIRLFLAVLCALGLAFSPLATTGAIASSSGMPGCTMGHMPAKPADHSKMDCCTPACQTSAAAALMSDRDLASDLSASGGVQHDRTPTKELASFTASGLDPPPRLPS